MGRPNLILLMADQLRWDVLGCAGHPDVRTANIDALAAHGIRFSEALCQSTDCVASRATVLSGQYPDAHEVSEVGEGILAEKSALAKKTIQEGISVSGHWQSQTRIERPLLRLRRCCRPGRLRDLA